MRAGVNGPNWVVVAERVDIGGDPGHEAAAFPDKIEQRRARAVGRLASEGSTATDGSGFAEERAGKAGRIEDGHVERAGRGRRGGVVGIIGIERAGEEIGSTGEDALFGMRLRNEDADGLRN